MIKNPQKSLQNGMKNSPIQVKGSLKEDNTSQSDVSLAKETSNNINQKIKDIEAAIKVIAN